MKVNWLALSAIIPTATGLVVATAVFMSDLKSDLKVTQTEIASIKTDYDRLRKDTETNRVELREGLREGLRELRGNLTNHQEIHVKEDNNGHAKN